MQLKKSGLILALFLGCISLAACVGGIQDNNNTRSNSGETAPAADVNANVAKTNVEELGMLVNVPYESEEAFWKEDPASKKVIAVLRFPKPESNRLITDAEKIGPPREVSITPETWFPPELIAQSETSGDDLLKGQAYPANSFFQPPYNEGRITRIENTDYFVLELNAK